MTARQRHSALRRLEGRFWTGPLAHLLGGSLDVLGALIHAGWHSLLRRVRN